MIDEWAVRRVGRYGGSIAVAIPPGVKRKAKVEEGQEVVIWTPGAGTVVIETSFKVDGEQTIGVAQANMLLERVNVIKGWREKGEPEAVVKHVECSMCGERHWVTEYNRMRMCAVCELVVAGMMVTARGGVLEKKSKE